MFIPKNKRIRSAKYINWIRSLPCANCYAPEPNEAHHAINIGFGGIMGDKENDIFAIPLCHKCHSDLHRDSKSYPQLLWILKTILHAFNEGIIGFK